MRILLLLALACAPGEFRREYREQIEFDVHERAEDSGEAAAYWSAFLNVVRAGFRMHVETLARDLAYCARTLVKARLFTVIVVGTLAIAIAANVTVFSVLDGLFLEPLPYPDSGHVMFVLSTYGNYVGNSVSYPDVEHVRAQSRALSSVAVQSPTEDTLIGESPIALRGFTVGSEYFDVLDVQPEIGRFFTVGDLGRNYAVISDALWRSRYNADPAAIGKPLRLATGTYTIVGVAKPGLKVPDRAGLRASDYWVPVNPRAPYVDMDGSFQYDAIGRSRRDVGIAAVNADLSRIGAAIARAHPLTHKAGSGERGLGAITLNRLIAGPVSQFLNISIAAVVCVLLIACANVANLLLLRAENRRHEIVVRAALGASRAALVRQMLTESALISVTGGATGLLLAWLALRYLPIRGVVPALGTIGINGAAILYLAGIVVFVTCVTTLAAAFAPKLLTGGLTIRGNSVSRPSGKLRLALTVSEIALAFALLVTSGLLVRSYWSLTHVPLGFETSGLYDIELTGQLPSGKYGNAQTIAQFAQHAVRELREIPGVTAAAAASTLPLLPMHPNESVTFIGAKRQPSWNWVYYAGVSPSYFSTLGLHLIAGEVFSDRSRGNAPVVVVNQAFERQYAGFYRHPNAVGLKLGGAGLPVTVIGVVSDARDALWAPAQPTIYFALPTYASVNQFIVRARPGDSMLATDIARSLRRVEPEMSDPRVIPFPALVAQNAGTAWSGALLLASLAGIALVLAIGGIYGIMAYSVQRRTSEIGLRIALGASVSAVLRRVLGTACVIAATGIAIGFGLIAAGMKGPWLSDLLYQVSPLDPITLVAVILVFTACVVVASLIPAVRAATIDAATALRYE